METRSCAERIILGRLRRLLDSGVVGAVAIVVLVGDNESRHAP